jgi:hypothetical protein
LFIAAHNDTIPAMRAYAYLILAAGWLAWVTPFFLVKRHARPAQKTDHRARWGVLLVAKEEFSTR